MDTSQAGEEILIPMVVSQIYSLLLRKTLGGFSFVASKLPNVDLLLKIDDDLDIRSPLISAVFFLLRCVSLSTS